MGTKFRGKDCKCPFHEDGHASAFIKQSGTTGHWYFCCKGCDVRHDVFSVRAHLNKTTVADELRKVGNNEFLRSADPPPRVFNTVEQIEEHIKSWATCERIEGVYKYTTPATGIPQLVVIRWWDSQEKRKKFTQCSKTPGGYWMKGIIGDNPIYNRRRIETAQTVVVVEGEKKVHALHELGIVATTSPGGALNGGKADWSPLAGKTCILWPDNDDPTEDHPEGKGAAHMREVQRILCTLNPPAKMMWLNTAELDLPAKGDCVDLIERLRATYSVKETAALVEETLSNAEPIGIMGEFLKEMDAIMGGKRRAIPLPWSTTTEFSRALMPGKVTCVCGDGGAGKSLFLSQCIVDWTQAGMAKVCVYHLEDDRNYHMLRSLAQLAGEARMTDPDWVEQNPEAAKRYVGEYSKTLEEVGARIFEAPDDQVSLEMLSVWVEARAKEGYEVIGIDPITAAESSARPWVEDLKFITRCKVICRRYGCRVIFITHPRTGAKSGKANHNDMAGGAAYPRFSHTVFWLERNDAEDEFSVFDGNLTSFMRPNRTLLIAKARNGPGAGRRMAFTFDPNNLRYYELGSVQKS